MSYPVSQSRTAEMKPTLAVVFFSRIQKSQVPFYQLPLKRLDAICGDFLNIVALYNGKISEDNFDVGRVKAIRYKGCSQDNRWIQFVLNTPSLIRTSVNLARERAPVSFMNIWEHYLMFPLSIFVRPFGGRVIARIAGDPLNLVTKATGFRNIYKFLLKYLQWISISSADIVAYIDKNQLDYLPPKKKRHIILPPGFDDKIYFPEHKKRKKSLLFVGRVKERKGIPELLEAFYVLAQRHDELELVIVGPMQLKSGYLKSEFLNRIKYLGFQPPEKLASLYREAACLVLPTKSEAFGNVVIEALSCGCPVVATGIGAIPRLVRDAGVLFSFPSPEKIASAVEDILISGGPVEEVMKRAADRMYDEFSFSRLRRWYKDLTDIKQIDESH